MPSLKLFPLVTVALLIGPIALGLVGTLLPALGYLPILGGETLSLAPWHTLWQMPGLGRSLWLSLSVGLVTTLASFAIVVLFCAAWHGTALFRRLQRLLSPLLSIPHVTVAFGLAFLIAPSGWLMRLLSPWATGSSRPPDWLIIHDPAGISLMLGLICKEVPFLFLMTLAALGQTDALRQHRLARTLGYGPMTAWLKVVLPQIYPQIRLPLFAVLAFGMSVVDVALVLGPTTPPPLAVQLVRWFNDPDLSLRYVASAGAVLQFALVLLALGIWWLLERGAAQFGRWWLRGGGRCRRDALWRWLAALPIGLCVVAVILSLAGLIVWSFASYWRFPAAFPPTLTLANWWRYSDDLLTPLWHTVGVAAASAFIAALLAVGCLEHEANRQRPPSRRSLSLLYLPLIVPQVAFLFGLQVLLIVAGIDGHWLALVWAHLVFVLPYVFLSLADPYRTWDSRYERSARCLGASPWRVWWRIKLPMLLQPLLIAWAVGFAVSAAQYLPTLFAGAGRFPTLTTEAVALSAGGDRRVIGVYGLLQMGLPLLAFSAALLIPAWRFRRRRGMQISH